jgi:uncharacterized membrane protein YoaK (UPF0700 family)
MAEGDDGGLVVFLGFALAGVPGFALSASLAAVAGFVVGAVIAGALVRRVPRDRRRALVITVGLETVLVLACLPPLVATAGQVGREPGPAVAAAVATLLAVAMGLQNGVVRHLAVPDLTTTVLTMTITGIAADRGRSGRPVVLRRVLAVTGMLAGAAVGAVLVQTVGLAWALVPVLVLLLGVLGTLLAHDRRAVWVPPL